MVCGRWFLVFRSCNKLEGFLFLFLFFFFLFWLLCRILEFLAQGSDLSHNCDLHCSCSNTRSFNPLCWAGGQTCILVLPPIPLCHRSNSTFGGFCFFCLFVCFCLFRATPESYGGFQARGPSRTTAASLCQSHSKVGSKPRLRPTPQLTATPDP